MRHKKPSFKPNLESIREVLVEVSTLPEIETPKQIVVTPPSSDQTPTLPHISSPTTRLIVPHDYFEPTTVKQPLPLSLSHQPEPSKQDASDEREHLSIRQVVVSAPMTTQPSQHPAAPLCSLQQTTPRQYSSERSPQNPSR